MDRRMDRQLLKACSTGDLNLLKHLVHSDPDILFSVTPFSNNCLHIAAILGHGEFAKEVWSAAPSLFSGTNIDGETPLISAVIGPDRSLASDMITAALQHLCPDGYKNDIERGHLFSEMLLKVDDDGNSALHHAIRNGLPDLALRLLTIDPRLSQQVNKNSESPMHMAVRREYVEVVDKLLAIPNSAHVGPSNYTAMHMAVKSGNADLVTKLLKSRPELAYETNENGYIPLMTAIAIESLEIVKLFLEHDPNLGYHRHATSEETPFSYAANLGHVHIAKEIISTCPDSFYRRKEGYNALHIAIIEDNSEFVEYVLGTPQLHRLINQASSDHLAPLHFAACKCDPELIRSFLSHERTDRTAVNPKSGDACSEVSQRQDKSIKTLKWNESFTLMTNSTQQQGWRKLVKHDARVKIKQEAIDEVKELTQRYTTNTSVVAALLATITFAAAFTLPGGYSSDALDTGLPVFAHKAAFQVFLISDTIAMCSSLAAAFLCVLVTWEDLDCLLHYRKTTQALMWCAYASTAVTFGTGLFTVMAPKSLWLAILALSLSCFLPFLSKIISDWPLLMLRYRLGRQFDSELIPNI